MDLGAAASGKGAKKDEVILAVPTEEKDINALYADELKLLAEPIPVIKPTRSVTQKQEDYYKVRDHMQKLAAGAVWLIPLGFLVLARPFVQTY